MNVSQLTNFGVTELNATELLTIEAGKFSFQARVEENGVTNFYQVTVHDDGTTTWTYMGSVSGYYA